jgi:N-methylhydantoinase B/oxoprolinase/acetone carboxylase alpha subunit
LASLVWAAATGAASAHHSFAMFDMEHPIEIAGTVKEFKFTSPHTLLILLVKGDDGVVRDWILEGGAPGNLVREGMTAKSLKPGDEITATINPLHSGAEGGSYQPLAIKFKNGTPVAQPK